MKVALIADIHDNHTRLEEALSRAEKAEIKTCICLGDVSNLETLEKVAKLFKKVYLALGNMDYKLAMQTELYPENVEWFSEEGGSFVAGGRKVFIVHYDFLARQVAESGKYDLVFYGHTHTPWEKKVGKTILLNPGEISGQFGLPSFAIYDLEKLKAELVVID